MKRTLHGNATILVVEDNAEARDIFVLTLAENGVEGIAHLREANIDVILTDLRMPVMDGIEMATTIKAKPAYSHIPIVVLTATPLADKAAMLKQFSAILLKPCSMTELLAAIADAAGQNKS